VVKITPHRTIQWTRWRTSEFVINARAKLQLARRRFRSRLTLGYNRFMSFEREFDEFWMREAMRAAGEAGQRDEVPIGACLIDKSGNLLAADGNKTRLLCDPTAHAEILVLREAAAKIGNYRLTETTLYTTIEPCAMCAGALVQARVKRLVFAALDERFGAVETLFGICDSSSLNHQMEITSGVLAAECRKLMQDFFRARRLKKRQVAD
jgi:tRNA(adenine34) deaminase